MMQVAELETELLSNLNLKILKNESGDRRKKLTLEKSVL